MTGWTELFGCSSCGRNFSTQDALTEHLDSPKHPYKCALCKSHYADKDAFRRHLDLTHSGYMCTFAGCSFWSATEPDVDEHSREHAQDQKGTGLKARKLGFRTNPDAVPKSDRRTKSTRDRGKHPSSVPLSSDQPTARNRKKAGAPASSSSTPRSSFDPRRMPCPFRRAIYKQCPSSIKDKYAACRSPHNNISSLIEHLSQPVHGLEVTERTISSFNVAPTVPLVRKAGMCKRCWKVFSAAAELDTHLTYPCKIPSLTTCDKYGILYRAFAKAGEIEETKETGSTSNEAQISADLTQQMPSVPSASRLPPLEENFLRDFMCCDRAWPTMHDLLQHYEDDHTRLKETQPMDSTPTQPYPVWKAGSQIAVAPDHAVSAMNPLSLPPDFGQSRRGKYSSREVDSTGADASLVSPQELMSAPPAVTEEALDAFDNFVLFPKNGVDDLDPFYLNITSSTTSHTQMAGSLSNRMLDPVLQATDNQVLSTERFPELASSGPWPSFRVERMEGDKCPSCTRSFPAGGGQCPHCEVTTLPAPDAREEKSRRSAAANVSPESTVKLPPFRLPEYGARTVDEMPRVRLDDNVGLDDHQNAAFMRMTEQKLYHDGGPLPPLPPPRFIPVSPFLESRFESEHDEYDPVNLKHQVPPPSAEVGSDPIAISWWKGFKKDTARATQEDDPVGVEDSQPPGRGNQQDINGGVDRTDSTASRPPLSNSESDTWKVRAVTKEPENIVTDHPDVSLRASHGAGSNFGPLEPGILPEPSDSGYAPARRSLAEFSISSYPEPDDVSHRDAYVATAQPDSGHTSALPELAEGSIFGNAEPDDDVSYRDAYVATAQTDSGYASHTREREIRLRGEDLDTKEPPQLADTDALAEDDETDVGTIYSDDRSQASVSRTQCYIAEFVDHLFGKIRHMMEDCSIGRLIECLPELLQAFALKVGQSAPTRGHFEVMYFVHKHRRAIALSLQDRIRQNESHGLAEVEDRETDPAGMSLDDKLSLWAEKASGDEPEHEFEDEELPDLEPFEDELDINELYRYQSLIVDSPAFHWLVGSMRREIQLDNSAVVGMMLIRRRMLQGLPSPRHVSRKEAVPRVQVTFTASWDPVSFVEEQGYDPDTEDILGKVITLTGSSTDVQAATCEQYLCQTWPSTGKHMLRILEDAFRKKAVAAASSVERRTYTLPDNTRITASCVNKTLTVEASGTAYSMVEIGEQLGWLTTALRSSPDESTMSVFYPTIARFQRGADPSQPFSCSISASFVGYDETPGGRVSRNGGCWHRMFKNPVVVWGYPIPRRPELEAGTGLEIPLDMLVALTDATGLSEFDGKTFIKGYSAMLIPTKQVEDLILWHLLFNEDGTRISYTDCRLASLDHIQTTDVKQARHILGWVSHARNNTGSPDANYHIKWTGLGKPRERHAWEKVIISGGDPVGVSASFVIGKKDKGIFAGALGGYTSRLKFIAKQYVVLYDLADRRAWLVDGLSALLHLVRASLEHDQRDVFNSFSLYKRGQIQECSPDLHGLDAAAAVLFNPENYSLKLYTESEDTWDEETERQHNGTHGSETVKEVVSKRKVTYYCLRDKVLEIFSLLEKMVDHLNNVSSETGVGFRLRGTPRNILEGFDFMDVATSGAPLRPHMIKLNICESGRGWTDLLRSIQAITLFGKGFGELIAPTTQSHIDPPCGSCGYGISLPTGKDYMATCVSLVERILEKRGDTETVPWCLADDIYWHTPGALFDPCQCANSNKGQKPSDRVQVLLPSTFPKLWGRSFASPSNLESAGAVIFSHNWRVPFRLGHQNSQDQKMLEPPDSGLGTSIDSSSGRSQVSGSFDDSETQASDALDGPSVHSAASPRGTQPGLDTVDLVLRPDNGTSNRKRKLVDIVDKVKRKVLKTSQNIELDQLTDGGVSQSAASSMDGTAPFIG